jgi:hypothetical protein
MSRIKNVGIDEVELDNISFDQKLRLMDLHLSLTPRAIQDDVSQRASSKSAPP